jgi:adenylate cyclase
MKDKFNELEIKFRELSVLNNQLQSQNSELFKQVETLLIQNNNYEKQLASLTSKQENSRGKRYKIATVLYAEVKGFNKLLKQINADELVDEIDELYHQFDKIVKKYNIVKANSIGDTYICVGGIPEKNHTNPMEVVLAAIEILKFLEEIQLKSSKKNIWKICIGIHTGSIIANITGTKKIVYDIKGDTVNMASRMVSSFQSGKIFISENTREFVSGFFRCSYCGKLPVKYVGDISIYNIKGIRPEFSEKGEGKVPNNNFHVKFALVRFDDVEEFILNKLESELPKNLYYHNLKHTIDVLIEVEIIGKGERINEEELLILKTAALFHDTGHIINSRDHEFHGTKIADEILPKFGYSPEQIVLINELIMATKLPPHPISKLQEILCDADLDYLGRADFIPVSNTLFKEMEEQGFVHSLNEWNKMQHKFLSNHQYFTKTANSLREVHKLMQLERIQQLISNE